MASTTLRLTFAKPAEQQRVTDILATSNIPRRSAEIIRDARGKVIAVKIVLPDSLSAAALAALARHPEASVASLGSSEPPINEFDGTEASLATYKSNAPSSSEVLEGTYTKTFNVDGTMTVECSSSTFQSRWAVSTLGDVTVSPNPSYLEGKFKFTRATGVTQHGIWLDNGFMELGLYVHNYDSNTYDNDNVLAVGKTDTDWHILKIQIVDAQTARYYIDGVLVKERIQSLPSLSAQNLTIAESVSSRISGTAPGSIIDYVKYTQKL